MLEPSFSLSFKAILESKITCWKWTDLGRRRKICGGGPWGGMADLAVQTIAGSAAQETGISTGEKSGAGLFFGVISTICELTGAALPAEVRVNWDMAVKVSLSHLVQIVNQWLSWVALNLDSWENALASAGAVKTKDLSILVKIWRGFVWVSQWAIWIVMWVARFASIRPVRRSILNGDQCEALIVGSAVTLQSLQKIPH